MESWQQEILEAVNASAQGLAGAKEQLAGAYNLVLEHIALRCLILKPTSGETLDVIRCGVRTATAKLGTVQNPSQGGS